MENNENKRKSYFLIGFAILYFIFTVFIVKHGIHFVNVTITIGVLIWAFILLLKDKTKNKK